MPSLRIGLLVWCACTAVMWAQEEGTPTPGMLNFIEGHVTMDGQPAVADGSEAGAVRVGHVLQTDQGRAEVLLTPGVFLRVAENSAIKMDAVSDHDVKVEVVKGEALVEVAQVDALRRVEMLDQGAETRLDHDGLYLFNASKPAISVYSGKARVDDDRHITTLAKGQQLMLNGNGSLKPQKFDQTEADGIYEWSEKRADLDAQTAEWTVEGLLALNDTPTFNAGWYWNPWYHSWAYVPQKGYHLTPFGYGYYPTYKPQSLTPVFGDFR
jgi:hypothetical protein